MIGRHRGLGNAGRGHLFHLTPQGLLLPARLLVSPRQHSLNLQASKHVIMFLSFVLLLGALLFLPPTSTTPHPDSKSSALALTCA